MTRRSLLGGSAADEFPSRRKAMDEDTRISCLDDFEVIAERRVVSDAIAALTDKYRRLCREMSRRETLRWMLLP
jgi:hypothetical protein